MCQNKLIYNYLYIYLPEFERFVPWHYTGKDLFLKDPGTIVSMVIIAIS